MCLPDLFPWTDFRVSSVDSVWETCKAESGFDCIVHDETLLSYHKDGILKTHLHALNRQTYGLVRMEGENDWLKE